MIAPYIFQRCVVCRRRFKIGLRPPTWWIVGRDVTTARIGPPGTGICWFHPARPLSMPAAEARTGNQEFDDWRERGRRLAWSLGRVLTPEPRYYRRPASSPPAKRQGRKVSGRRRSMWGPVYVTSTPPLWPLRR